MSNALKGRIEGAGALAADITAVQVSPENPKALRRCYLIMFCLSAWPEGRVSEPWFWLLCLPCPPDCRSGCHQRQEHQGTKSSPSLPVSFRALLIPSVGFA